MKKLCSIYLKDILQSAKQIQKYYRFVSDFQTLSNVSIEFDAIIRRFIVIGEATTRIPKEVQDNYQNVQWR